MCSFCIYFKVENKLEQLFAGIADDTEPFEPLVAAEMKAIFDNSKTFNLDESKGEGSKVKQEDATAACTSGQMNDSVSSTSNDIASPPGSGPKRGRPKKISPQDENEREISPKRKKVGGLSRYKCKMIYIKLFFRLIRSRRVRLICHRRN